MKSFVAIIAATLLSAGLAHASDELLGSWTPGGKELLSVYKDGDKLTAEFIRQNVKAEFERIRFPATLKDGALVISGEQGDLSAKYDEIKKRLVLGGFKEFQKISKEEALALLAAIEKGN